VHYFEEYLKKFDSIGKPFPWEGIRLSIKSLRISPIPKTGLSPFFVILNSEGKKVFDSAKKLSIESFKAKDACADFRVGCNVRGDFKIVFYNKFTLQSVYQACISLSDFALEENLLVLVKHQLCP
jgi:hypothetical protein